MPPHAIGSATISFGLVSVPIKMFSAGESSAAISFNMLHKKDGARLKQQYICSKDGEKVERDDTVKGYEFAKGQYVVFTKDELKALDEKGTGSIDIMEFVDADTVDRMYMDRVYFLGPDKGGDRAFTLLGEAMKKTGKVAIGQWAARGKQYLIMIRPLGPGLAMEQLRYANEVRSIDEVPIPKIEVKKAEVDLAVQFIQQTASKEFEPDKYEDTVKKRILEQIERKVEGKEITEEPAEAPKTQIIDLMEALKASLAKGKSTNDDERKPARRAERADKPAKTRQMKKKAASA
jgi:DNA end-binding protein Ku